MSFADRILASRLALSATGAAYSPPQKSADEGGCGVLGVASSFPIEGRDLVSSLTRMRNRGNGKGGGVALVGLDPAQWGVNREILERDYLIEIAYLDGSIRAELEEEFIRSVFEVDHVENVRRGAVKDAPMPPEVRLYFARPRAAALESFQRTSSITDPEAAADELVYQNTFKLHKRYYASLGEKKAFVLSHGKDMLNFKLVGYAEQAIEAYGLESATAHVWIGHHRYPTKGKVWHPGGAHPFIGVNEALVHNGDFANYASICDSLAQRGVWPLFLTDTEVGVQLFDLLRRVYGYPLEHVIEALAPTTDRDFSRLPADRQELYRRIQRAHVHASPDGPWFFIVASHDRKRKAYELIGITDTSMLRPQVFSLQEGGQKVGAVASEKQAIDAFFESLHARRKVPCARADLYWNARGGSAADGGAFIYSVTGAGARKDLSCVDKFGGVVRTPEGQSHYESP